jgi:hypothetical protein
MRAAIAIAALWSTSCAPAEQEPPGLEPLAESAPPRDRPRATLDKRSYSHCCSDPTMYQECRDGTGRPITRDAGMHLDAPLFGHGWSLRGAMVVDRTTRCTASFWALVECEHADRVVVASASLTSMREVKAAERIGFAEPLLLSHPAIGKPERCEITTYAFFEYTSRPIDEHCSENGVTRPGPCGPPAAAPSDPDPAWVEALAFVPSPPIVEGPHAGEMVLLALVRGLGDARVKGAVLEIIDSRDGGTHRLDRDPSQHAHPSDTFVLGTHLPPPTADAVFELVIDTSDFDDETSPLEVFCWDRTSFVRGRCPTLASAG